MTFLSRRRYELLALAIALVCGAIHLWTQGQPEVGMRAGEENVLLRGVHVLEGRATDLKFHVRGARAPHPDVVVVAVDEKATQRFGLWPWPRDRVAAAVAALHGAGAKSIGLDITFTDRTAANGELDALISRFDEAAKAAPPDAATHFAAFRQSLDASRGQSPDAALARALAGAPEVVQGLIAYGEPDLKDFPPERVKRDLALLPPHLITRAPGRVKGSTFEIALDRINGYPMYAAQAPLPEFVTEASRFGHFNFAPDADGVLRRMPVLVNLTGAKGLLPSLSLQVAATWLGAQPEPIYDAERAELAGVRLAPEGREPIVVPYQGLEPFTLINYPGPAELYPTVSIADVIDGTFRTAEIAGKAVLVGVTTVGESGDQRVTPFKELEPGVYSHAAMVSNILSGDFLTRPPSLLFFELATILVFAFALAVFIPRAKLFRTKALFILAAAVVWLVVDNAFFAAGLRLASVMPVANLLACSFGLVFLGYLSVDQDKQRLRETFSKYLGADVMEEALQNPEKLNRGEKREMSVLFSDIRGFTTLSERMLPDKLAAFIKEYLTPMTQIVFDEKGTLDKYIGDAVMAFWNAPLDQADHAFRACRASVEMLKALDALKARWRAENYPEFDIGVGINTGVMHVGNMGSEIRSDYTVMGDAVNLASRPEGTNKEYETPIIISEATGAQVKDRVIARRLGAVRVKGKRKPVRIYELRGIGQPDAKEAETIRLFEGGLDAYGDQKWDDAANFFKLVVAAWPGDPPARRYLEELEVLKVRPPGPGWDGVYTATTK